jgi:hypothetical protein
MRQPELLPKRTLKSSTSPGISVDNLLLRAEYHKRIGLEWQGQNFNDGGQVGMPPDIFGRDRYRGTRMLLSGDQSHPGKLPKMR